MARPLNGVWLFLLSLFGLHAGSASANSGVICIPGTTGESTREVGCSDVLAWSWGASASFGPSSATNLQDVSLTKYIDTASNSLLQLLVTRTTVKGGPVTYDEYKDDCAGGCVSPAPYLTIHLNVVQVSSLSTGNSSGGGAATENITLQFDAFSYCYRPTVNGVLGTAQCTAWSKTSGPISPF